MLVLKKKNFKLRKNVVKAPQYLKEKNFKLLNPINPKPLILNISSSREKIIIKKI